MSLLKLYAQTKVCVTALPIALLFLFPGNTGSKDYIHIPSRPLATCIAKVSRDVLINSWWMTFPRAYIQYEKFIKKVEEVRK